MTDAEITLLTMLKFGIKVSIDGKITGKFEQFEELQKVLKEQYDIEFNQELFEDKRKPKENIPILETYEKPLDGKAKHRERRKQERIKNKRR